MKSELEKSSRSAGQAPLCIAVFVTYNRFEICAECLDSLYAQHRPPDRIVVVDNASPDGTADLLPARYPDIELVRMEQNLGVAGGLAAGMRRAQEWSPDVYWLVEDDTKYDPHYLKQGLAMLEDDPGIAMLGRKGWKWSRGMWRSGQWPQSEQPTPIDLVLLDGALVRGAAVEECGVPAEDYFMMIQDVEYPLRLRDAGYRGYMSAALRADVRKMGALAPAPAANYRSYYQVRNHVRLIISRRSPLMFIRLFPRLIGLIWMDLRSDSTVDRLLMRSAGLVDGLRGRMGVTVMPGARRPSRAWRG
jgi:rhamnopyranosyl-N-acetylglucosaminyl-diphospho-decaprenol beta-1,3/1,4-galactofuranosyltransferase